MKYMLLISMKQINNLINKWRFYKNKIKDTKNKIKDNNKKIKDNKNKYRNYKQCWRIESPLLKKTTRN